jgi:small subunit ribosomal protein S1
VENLWTEIYSSRQNRSVLDWMVTGVEEYNDTLCLVMTKNRIKGLIPLSESGVTESENPKLTKARLSSLLGQHISFIVTHTDKNNNLFIGSRLKATEKLSSNAWNKLAVGQTKQATARRIIKRPTDDGTSVNIGVVCEIEGIEAFLPIQELSHGWVNDVNDLIQPGDTFNAKIIEVDKDKRKLTLSVKALTDGPWPDCVNRYSKNSFYAGIVTGALEYGVFVNLEPGLDAFCKLPKSGRVHEGDSVSIIITRISAEEQRINGVIHRILLSRSRQPGRNGDFSRLPASSYGAKALKESYLTHFHNSILERRTKGVLAI